MAAYATVDEYRNDTGDTTSAEARVQAKLDQQSSKLRAHARISSTYELTNDQAELARLLVVDAVYKSLVSPSIEGVDLAGVTQGSFTANGFQQSYTLQNPSGTSYFDRDTLKEFMRSLGRSQSIGTCMPAYGRC